MSTHGNWRKLTRAEAEGSMFACHVKTCVGLASYVCNAHPFDGEWCGQAWCAEHLPRPAQQPGACSPACVHLMEAATLSARLVEAEERIDKCMVALRACAGLQFGKCPICGHRISQCDKNPIWGDETCGGHLARMALEAIKP